MLVNRFKQHGEYSHKRLIQDLQLLVQELNEIIYTDLDARYYTKEEIDAAQLALGQGLQNQIDDTNTELDAVSLELSNVSAQADGLQTDLTALTGVVATKLPTASYTAADVLTKIKTVDGTGSGLDSDTVDGVHLAGLAETSTLAVGIDLNTVLKSGMYRLTTGHANTPGSPVFDHGQMLVSRGMDTIAQIVIPYNSEKMTWRSAELATPTWTPWKFVTPSEIAATKALADADKLRIDALVTHTGGYSSRVQNNIFNYGSIMSSSAPMYVHFKTNRTMVNYMDMLEFKGQEYASNKPIDARIVWYAYAASNNLINVGYQGSHVCTCYKSTDGYAVAVLAIASSYYFGTNVNHYGVTPMTYAPLAITSAYIHTAATGVY